MRVEERQPEVRLRALEREWKRRTTQQGGRVGGPEALRIIRARMAGARLFVALERSSAVGTLACIPVGDMVMVPWFYVLGALADGPLGADLLEGALVLLEREEPGS